MAKVLRCGDVVPGWKAEIKGDSAHDVLRKAAEHAETSHNRESVRPDVSKVKGAIHDDGEARTQRAGSSKQLLRILFGLGRLLRRGRTAKTRRLERMAIDRNRQP
jgi:predicted small metal-binding protein